MRQEKINPLWTMDYYHQYPKNNNMPTGLFRFQLRADGEILHVAAPLAFKGFVGCYKQAKQLRTMDILPIEVSVGNTGPGREMREYLSEVIAFTDLYAGPDMRADLARMGLATVAPLFRCIVVYTPNGFRLPIFEALLHYS